MVKSNLMTTIDTEILTLAKQRIDNISGFVENALRIELDVREKSKTKTDKEIIEDLEIMNAHLAKELEMTTKKLKDAADMGGKFDGFRKA